MTEARPITDSSIQHLAAEYVTLNWRRLGGGPRLDPVERRRWRELRTHLELLLGDTPPPEDTSSPRGSLRVPSRVWVRYRSGEADTRLEESQNLSEDGIFIASRAPLAPGTSLRLEIEAGPGMEPVKALGVVVWTRRSRQGSVPGMGVHFQGLGAEQRLALAGQLTSALVAI